MSGDKPKTIMDVEDITLDDSTIEGTTVNDRSQNTIIENPSSNTTLELLRHGELEGDDIFRGSTDDQLTNNGWQQMVSAIEGKDEWDIIITSPLSSCREFAEVIAQEDETDLEINEQFQEIDFGDWEGLSPDKILKQDADKLKAWWQSPTRVTPPKGEDFHEFQARILKFLKQMIENNKGNKILLITHAGVIRVILMHALGMHEDNLFRLNVDNASVSKIMIYHDKQGDSWSLISHGCVPAIES